MIGSYRGIIFRLTHNFCALHFVQVPQLCGHLAVIAGQRQTKGLQHKAGDIAVRVNGIPQVHMQASGVTQIHAQAFGFLCIAEGGQTAQRKSQAVGQRIPPAGISKACQQGKTPAERRRSHQ